LPRHRLTVLAHPGGPAADAVRHAGEESAQRAGGQPEPRALGAQRALGAASVVLMRVPRVTAPADHAARIAGGAQDWHVGGIARYARTRSRNASSNT